MNHVLSPLVCPNCRRTREGDYCGGCGQNNRDYRRSLPPMMMELLREAFELDGRVANTLKLLFSRPGALSVEFSQNRRASYVSPVRLYIFASLVFFFIFSQTAEININQDSDDEPVQIELDDTVSDENLAAFKSVIGPQHAREADEILRRDGTVAYAVLTGIINGFSEDDGAQDTDAGVGIRAFLLGQLVRALHDPARTFEDIIDNAPVALILLLPIYALLLKLVYLRSNRYYVEHFVFSLHLHVFMFMLMPISMLWPDSAGDELVSNLSWLVFFVYCYKALRRYYGQSRLKTLLKFFLLQTGYGLLMIPSALLVMATTVTLL